MANDPESRRTQLARRYRTVRELTDELAAPLSAEDQTVQSMPDVSPTKWHRAHTSWFFETFVLGPGAPGYRAFDPSYTYLFNSYYEMVGARHPRHERGLLSRPGAAEIGDYRRHVDRAMGGLLAAPVADEQLNLVELGLHHEQQHQELLLMDIKHVLSRNPVPPVYRASDLPSPSQADKPGWSEHQGGPAEIGHRGPGFAFDNESPRHTVQLTPFALADRPVTCGDWLDFMEDGGYRRPELWLSDGWATVQQQGWTSPLYWSQPAAADGGRRPGSGPDREAPAPSDREWRIFTLSGERPVDPAEPVCHVSYYEADAFAHWTGCRLPTEAEWEVVVSEAVARAGRATAAPTAGTGAGEGTGERLLDLHRLHPAPVAAGGGTDPLGDVWEWTASSYSPYPGFRTAPGAVGEYNGKFMVNQYVLRGGSCATPQGHVRPTYRNFFPAGARWAFSGLRLARDL